MTRPVIIDQAFRPKSTLDPSMQIRLEIDGILLPIGYSALANIVANLQDNGSGELHNALLKLCTHPASDVRAAVAGREDLAEEMVELLCKDNSREVLCSLTRNFATSAMLKTDDIARMIGIDVEVAIEISRSLSDFAVGDIGKIIPVLASHPDPAVRDGLVRSGRVPKKLLRGLSKDDDASVRNAVTSMYQPDATAGGGRSWPR